MTEPRVTSNAAPDVRFLLGGVQKGGTTALARYLAVHPDLALPRGKEAHVFDAPDFDGRWTAAQVDARFAAHFEPGDGEQMRGDATPITVFHPALVARVARYNPAMRWVILLRDPVERAISQYFMERGRGHEPRSLAAAVLLERARLRGHGGDWSPDSPLRVFSYVARGRYARQLAVLLRHFPRQQVLLLQSRDLAEHPAQTVAQVLEFLGLRPLPVPPAFAPVFAGGYRAPPAWAPGRLLLRLLLRGERAALRREYGIDLA